MCGIIAVVRRPSRRTPPDAGPLLAELDAARATLDAGPSRLAEAAAKVAGVDRALRGVPGVTALLAGGSLVDDIDARLAVIEKWIGATDWASQGNRALIAQLLGLSQH